MVFNSKDFPPLPSTKKKTTVAKPRNNAQDEKTPTPPGRPVTINDLPEELILNILDYLPGIDMEDFQLSTLLSLSLTNRRFHRMVADRLFLTYNSHFCEPYLFLRTMCSRPDLAKLVQHADFVYGLYIDVDRTRYVASAQDKKVIKEGMRRLGLPDWKSWAMDCNDTSASTETLHAAVLMHTPNISFLKVQKPGQYDTKMPRWLEPLKKIASGMHSSSMHQFENLRSVNIDASKFEAPHILVLFRLQTIRKLHLSKFVTHLFEKTEMMIFQHQIPRSSNQIEEFVFERSSFSRQSLTLSIQVFVRSSRRLRTLKLDASIDTAYEDLTSVLKIADMLESQKEYLENLRIDPFFHVENDGTFSGVDFFLGLQEFTALKHYACPLYYNRGLSPSSTSIIDCLPASLLQVKWRIETETSPKIYMSALQQLVISLSTRQSLLEEVHLFTPTSKAWDSQDWTSMIKCFSETQISFTVQQIQDEDEDDGSSVDWAHESTDSSNSSDEVSLYSDRG